MSAQSPSEQQLQKQPEQASPLEPGPRSPDPQSRPQPQISCANDPVDRPESVASSDADEGSSHGSLAGLRIAVTSNRRAQDLIDALARHGAQTVHAATMRIVPVEDDAELIVDTEALLRTQPKHLLVSTGQGFTDWLGALPDPLRERTEQWIRSVPVWCRGPKARGAVRGAGFTDPPSAPEETTRSLVDMVLDAGVRDVPVALQRHGYLDRRQLARLTDAGCSVQIVAPYRWVPGPDPSAVDALVDDLIAGRLDAITFTAAPSVEALWAAARKRNLEERIQAAMRSTCRVFAVGHVTAQPLLDADIPVTWPERERMGALVKHMVHSYRTGSLASTTER
ncbi:uroporphyrinogen-III synthase [Devriesea agamarum]|uniref:uroporphyrinogen-III synthase n=1 Tax=Devriesea agamarum TaxID=472569 RepID=UPI00071DB2DA|nr:uroporphyrinogen-III synthase [Devriesea agamarum]